jgi:hypothetical protein
MPIDRQSVVAREQKYTDGKPGLDDLQKCYVMAMLQLIFFQSALLSFKALLYILDTCVIFLRLFYSAFISFHGALFHLWRFISFMALLFFGKELLFKLF